MDSSTNGRDREKLRAVTRSSPCPVCEGSHKCSVGDGGLILCGRRSDPVPGFRHLGASKDPQFHLFRRDDEGGPPPCAGTRKPPKPDRPRDWGATAGRFAAALTPERRGELSRRLGLPVEALDALPLLGTSGAGAAGSTFTFPECDAGGRVVGITERIPSAGGKDVKKNLYSGPRKLDHE